MNQSRPMVTEGPRVIHKGFLGYDFLFFNRSSIPHKAARSLLQMSPLMRTEGKLERREQKRRTAGMGINHFLTNKHCTAFPHPPEPAQEGVGVHRLGTVGAPEAGGLSDPGPSAWTPLTLLAVTLLDWTQVAKLKG